MQGMLNFPLYGSVSDVMARGHTTQELAERIRQNMQIHSDPHRMPSFLDNHDVDRFLKGGNELALRQSLALIMTLPGIPTLYYGTEQGFKEQRAAMFGINAAASHDDWIRGEHFCWLASLLGRLYCRCGCDIRNRLSHCALLREHLWYSRHYSLVGSQKSAKIAVCSNHVH